MAALPPLPMTMALVDAPLSDRTRSIAARMPASTVSTPPSPVVTSMRSIARAYSAKYPLGLRRDFGFTDMNISLQQGFDVLEQRRALDEGLIADDADRLRADGVADKADHLDRRALC